MKYLFIAILVILVSCKSKDVKEKINIDITKAPVELQNQNVTPDRLWRHVVFILE